MWIFKWIIHIKTDVSKALNGYKPLDMWLEEHETDDYLYFSLQEELRRYWN